MKREWINIKGFRGKYQVSNDGIVRSFAKRGHYFKKCYLKRKPTILTQIKNSKGYFRVTLDKKKRVWKSVARLVASAFIDNNENLPQINHKDFNKLNNNVSNLEWCSCKQNVRHAMKMRKRKAKGAI